jgi:hypothetical protein
MVLCEALEKKLIKDYLSGLLKSRLLIMADSYG